MCLQDPVFVKDLCGFFSQYHPPADNALWSPMLLFPASVPKTETPAKLLTAAEMNRGGYQPWRVDFEDRTGWVTGLKGSGCWFRRKEDKQERPQGSDCADDDETGLNWLGNPRTKTPNSQNRAQGQGKPIYKSHSKMPFILQILSQ